MYLLLICLIWQSTNLFLFCKCLHFHVVIISYQVGYDFDKEKQI